MASWMPDGQPDFHFKVESTPKFSVLSFDANAKPPKEDKGAAAKGGKGAAKGGAKGAKPNASSAANGPAAEGEEDKGRKRVNVLLKNELQVQAKWAEDGTFESNPLYNDDGSPKPKFMVTFPYPYMNGRLHLGHAFSLTKAEFAAGFKRMKGYNVLFPFGFHCTGMPIQAAANKLKAEIVKFGNPPNFPVAEEAAAKKGDKGKGKSAKGKVAQKSSGVSYQWQTLGLMGIPESEISEFAEPEKWLDYFPPFGSSDLKSFGACIDWRRSFITTSRNPYYNKFIEWQFRRLRANDKIYFGKRPGIYSPLDGQTCADHDRAEGEGVAPQEYTLIKLRVQSPFPPALAALEGQDVFLTPATLRPETMYGQTNCFVLPEGDYGAFKWANGEIYVMSARSAKGLSFQSYQNVDFATTWGQTECLLTCKGTDLLGVALNAPRAPYPTVYTLPLDSISMGKGTGVVTSVPSDAPDDFIALRHIQGKADYYQKTYGITPEMHQPFDVVDIINITVAAKDGEEAWSSDRCAEYWSEKLKIKNPGDRKNLDEAKKKTYNAGFSFGKMLVGPYKGEKVSIAKPKEKQDMIDEGTALIYFEPEEFVKSRSGEECVVAMTDQWYLKYGDEEWKNRVTDHVNNPDTFTPYSQEILDKFNQTLGWLKEWACSRLFGLGTQLPWDDKWVIESLSDSTIYMAYYTIAALLQGPDNLCGDNPSPCGVTAEQLNDEVFDYIFMGRNLDFATDIPTAVLDQLKGEFEYWYPMDLRVSGKDLIGNHLTMSLYNHAAIWDQRPDLWPRGFYTNGFVNINNQKMSKSTGNFLMLEEAKNLYSADATRFALADAGDTLLDANFEREVADKACNNLFNDIQFVEEMLEAKAAGKLRTGDKLLTEQNLENEMNKLILDTEGHFTGMMWRDGLKTGYNLFHGLKAFYVDWAEKMDTLMHEDVIMRWLECSILMIAPICPHYAEVAWGMLGNEGSAVKAAWPTPSETVDAKASRAFNFLTKTVKNLRALASKDKTKNPTKAHIYIANGYSPWKIQTLEFLQTLWDDATGKMPEKKAFLPLVTTWLNADPELKKLKKNIMQFAAFMAAEADEIGKDALEVELPYDQKAVLQESQIYIAKALITNKTMEVLIYNLDEADIPGPATKKDKAEPSKPTLFLE